MAKTFTKPLLNLTILYMKLANNVMLLNTKQLLHLQDVLVSAGLAFETGGDYRDIFRTEKK